jgi:hypothetical protein
VKVSVLQGMIARFTTASCDVVVGLLTSGLGATPCPAYVSDFCGVQDEEGPHPLIQAYTASRN